MKTRNPQDERVMAQRHQIHSEAYGIVMIALFSSILIQQFLLKAPFEQYAVETVCFFGMSLYVIIRYMTCGMSLYGEGKRANANPFVSGIAAGMAVTAMNGVLNYMQYADRYKEDGWGYFIAVLAVTFISATALVFAVLSCLHYLNRKRQEKIQKQLDEKEREE
jgi:hypothetical protein